jgi:hypothetical protein
MDDRFLTLIIIVITIETITVAFRNAPAEVECLLASPRGTNRIETKDVFIVPLPQPAAKDVFGQKTRYLKCCGGIGVVWAKFPNASDELIYHSGGRAPGGKPFALMINGELADILPLDCEAIRGFVFLEKSNLLDVI